MVLALVIWPWFTTTGGRGGAPRITTGVTEMAPLVQATVSAPDLLTLPRNIVPLMPIVAVLVSTLNLSGATFAIFPVIVLKAPSPTLNLAFASFSPKKYSSILKVVFEPTVITVLSLKIICAVAPAKDLMLSFSSSWKFGVAFRLVVPLSIVTLPLTAVTRPTEANAKADKIKKEINTLIKLLANICRSFRSCRHSLGLRLFCYRLCFLYLIYCRCMCRLALPSSFCRCSS